MPMIVRCGAKKLNNRQTTGMIDKRTDGGKVDRNSRERGRAPSVRDGERVVGSGMEGIWRASVIARNNNAGVIAYVWVEGSSEGKKN